MTGDPAQIPGAFPLRGAYCIAARYDCGAVELKNSENSRQKIHDSATLEKKELTVLLAEHMKLFLVDAITRR